jgi:hypothetical protein
MEENYEETVKSRFDDIIKDGPSIYTGILEIIDNMIGWGNADHITCRYIECCPLISRPYMQISDNSKDGFGDVESIGRFFTLGKTNKKATESTIGKYGKGGYKAVIAMSDIFELITHIKDKKYTYGTNFRQMEKKNTWNPTSSLNISNNLEENGGSTFKIYFRFNSQISSIFKTENLKRHIIRGYHDIQKDVQFTIISESKKTEDTFRANNFCPYEEYVSKKTNYVYYTGEEEKQFVDSTEEKENSFAVINSYILKDTITKNKYLGTIGNKVPGIDFYRNGRMCNTRYPISKIGQVANLLQKGQMRGKRCHITINFTDKKVSEIKSFDDCIGVTTVKDIYEDDRMEKSLIETLEKVADECAKDYEEYTKKQKDAINDYLKEIDEYISSLNTKEKILNDTKLDKYHEGIKNYTTFKVSYYDEDENETKFCKNDDEVSEQKKIKNNPLRKNAKPIVKATELLSSIKKYMNEKKRATAMKQMIEAIMKEKGINESDAKEIYEKERNIRQQKDKEKKMKEAEEERLKEEEENRIQLEKEAEEARLKEEKEAEEARLKEEEQKLIQLEKEAEEARLKEEKEVKVNKLKEDVLKIKLEDLQKFWIETHKNIIMKE